MTNLSYKIPKEYYLLERSSKESESLLKILRKNDVILKKTDLEYLIQWVNPYDGFASGPRQAYGYTAFADYEIKIYSDENPGPLSKHFIVKNFPLVNVDCRLDSLNKVLKKAEIDVEIVPLAFAMNQAALSYLESRFKYGENFRSISGFCSNFWDYPVRSDYDNSYQTHFYRNEPPIKVIDLTKPFYSRICDKVVSTLRGD